MGNERRKYYRLPKTSKVFYEVLQYPLNEKSKRQAQYTNIGGGGLLFETDVAFDQGDMLKLDITILGWQKKSKKFLMPQDQNMLKPLTVIGKVIRTEDVGPGVYETGVEFIDVYEDDFKALIKFIEEKVEKESPIY